MTNADYTNMMAVLGGIKRSIDVKGLTKREYFAAMALQGLMANSDRDVLDYGNFANLSVVTADELIKALTKQPVEGEE